MVFDVPAPHRRVSGLALSSDLHSPSMAFIVPTNSPNSNKANVEERSVSVEISTETPNPFKLPKPPQNNTPEFSYIPDVHLHQVLAMQMHSGYSRG